MRNTENGSGLGRRRWVMERTFAWMNQVRRLRLRYEKRADMHEAFLSLACVLICWNFLQASIPVILPAKTIPVHGEIEGECNQLPTSRLRARAGFSWVFHVERFLMQARAAANSGSLFQLTNIGCEFVYFVGRHLAFERGHFVLSLCDRIRELRFGLLLNLRRAQVWDIELLAHGRISGGIGTVTHGAFGFEGDRSILAESCEREAKHNYDDKTYEQQL